MSEITALYCVTPDSRFRRMAAASIYSLLQHNPGIPVRVTEVEGGDYPLGIKPQPLASPVDTPWVLFLDADTRVTGGVASLLAGLPEGCQFCARPETMWDRNIINRQEWEATCLLACVPSVPVYNTGAWLLRASAAKQVGALWIYYMGWLPENAQDPLRGRKQRYPWWMLEQCALSLAVVGLSRLDWTKKDHSYQWCSEDGGLIHHYSAKRWKDFL